MDSWPADDRIDDVTGLGRKGKRKGKEKAGARNYPDLDHGAINATTLFEKDGRLEWASIVKSTNHGENPNRLYMGKVAAVFPPTRPPRLYMPPATALQRAERGANFLRTYLPDVDIPAEIIRDEIAQDARIMRDLEPFDPHAGNLLEPVVAYNSTNEDVAFLAFPMGELNRDLNLSQFRYLERKGIKFMPSAHPIRTFKTPIRQIISTRSPSNSYLAIRTFGLTSLLDVKANVTSRRAVQLRELSTILHADVGNREVVDIKLFSSPFEALTVTDHGAVYRCDVANGRQKLTLVHPVTDDSTGLQDSFWRFATGENSVACFLASSKAITRLDLRTNTPVNFWSVPEQQGTLTSVEDPDADNIIRLCSTRQILWIDQRFPKKPLIGYKHGRNYDRSLETRTINLKTASTLLTSRNNGLVTVYDVSRSDGRLVHVQTPPYCLLPDKGAGDSHTGQAFFRHPLDLQNENFSLFRLSESGGLHHSDIYISGLRHDPVLDTVWSTAVKRLEGNTPKAHTNEGPLVAREFSEIDLLPVYDSMFRVHTIERRKAEEEKAQAVYDVLEQIPTILDDSDVPVEHILTTYDAVFRAGEEPVQTSRADFLTESIVNSARGYRALVQGRLSAQSLKKKARWHYDIGPTLKHLDPNFGETLDRYDLAVESGRPAESFRQESEAREQLTLDLALSSDVFSSQGFSRNSDEGLELEAMTKSLSLDGEPSSVHFGYLQPLSKDTADHYTKMGNDEVVTSLGARSLLRDWEIGVNPRNFLFRDIYDGARDSRAIRHAKPTLRERAGGPATSQNPLATHRPPLVFASGLPHQSEATRRGLYVGLSQGSSLPPMGATSQPTPAASNTQILYGSRASAVKKPGRKRLGGF